MPSLTLYVDKEIAASRLNPERVKCLSSDLQIAVQNHLNPAPDTFQINMIVCQTCGPAYPISMTLHFRASKQRDKNTIMACLEEIAANIESHLKSRARLRAFATGKDRIFALDHQSSRSSSNPAPATSKPYL